MRILQLVVVRSTEKSVTSWYCMTHSVTAFSQRGKVYTWVPGQFAISKKILLVNKLQFKCLQRSLLVWL